MGASTLDGERACPVPTLRGDACTCAPLDDLPCCFNHLRVWAQSDPANLLAVIKARANTLAPADVWPRRQGAIALSVPRKDTRFYQSGFIRFTLTREEKQVVADLLASLGNEAAAIAILRAHSQPQ